MNARDLDKLTQGSLPLDVFLVMHRGTGQVVRACATWGKADRFCAAMNAAHPTTPYWVVEL
jgi:hypothetical protein